MKAHVSQVHNMTTGHWRRAIGLLPQAMQLSCSSWRGWTIPYLVSANMGGRAFQSQRCSVAALRQTTLDHPSAVPPHLGSHPPALLPAISTRISAVQTPQNPPLKLRDALDGTPHPRYLLLSPHRAPHSWLLYVSRARTRCRRLPRCTF